MATLALAGGVLIGLYTWAVILGRILRFSAARRENREFVPKLAGCLKDRRLDEAIKVANKFKKSPLAETLVAALITVKTSSGKDQKEIASAAERAMSRTSEIVSANLRSSLPTLEIVSAISPAIALLYSHQAAITLGVLVTTPAVVFGIGLRNAASRLEMEMKVSTSEMFDVLLELREQIPLSSARK